LICDPDMPNKTVADRVNDIRVCIGCNQACIGHVLTGHGVSCIQHPETGREVTYGTRRPAETRRRILVAGGGPAGMKAAAVAAERGHDVMLYEAADRLGGQVSLAGLLPGRSEFAGLATNLEREMALAGVRVELGTPVGHDVVDAEAPDAIVIATGANVRRPALDLGETSHVVDAWQVLNGEANVGARVVIADWRCDWVGIGLAEMLAQNGSAVTLAVNGTMPGQTIQQYVRDRGIGRILKLGVEIVAWARPYGADESSVYLQNTLNGEPIVIDGVDTLVLAMGHESETSLEESLADLDIPRHVIGDCLTPRTAEEAVLEGLKAGTTV
jgi:pyruvate/2-oxoglutarate dehydrogenase complex dihydrolipoamide dehydrogenase (E3) component